MKKDAGHRNSFHLSKIAFRYISGDLKSGIASPDSTSAIHTLSLPLLLSSYLKTVHISNYSNTSALSDICFKAESINHLINSNSEGYMAAVL
jgi:hypothetical protein